MKNLITEVKELSKLFFLQTIGAFSGTLTNQYKKDKIPLGTLLKGNDDNYYKVDADIIFANYTLNNEYDYLIYDITTNTINVVNIAQYNYNTWQKYIPLFNSIYGIIDARILYFDTISFSFTFQPYIACINAQLKDINWNFETVSKYKLTAEDKNTTTGRQAYKSSVLNLGGGGNDFTIPLTLYSQHFLSNITGYKANDILHKTAFHHNGSTQKINFLQGFYNSSNFQIWDLNNLFSAQYFIRFRNTPICLYFNPQNETFITNQGYRHGGSNLVATPPIIWVKSAPVQDNTHTIFNPIATR